MRTLPSYVKPALLGLLALVAPFASAGAQARTISNIATVEWDGGDGRMRLPSNQIDIDVATTRPIITTHQLGTGGGSIERPIPGTQCLGSNGEIPLKFNGVFADVPVSPASLIPTSRIHANEPVIFSVVSPDDNRDVSTVESFRIVLRTPEGDRETITVTETSANSSEFIGFINTRANPPSPVQGDCVLTVKPGTKLEVDIRNGSNDDLLGDLELEILIDPFGIVFDSGDGSPVSGVRVTLIDVATGLPAADVFGDDGVSRFPNSILTGSTVSDSSGQQYVFEEGFYRFPFARPGTYRLLIEPPSPYTAPSNATPADLAGFRRPDGPAFTILPGSFGGNIVLDDPAPVRIDVPIDRPGAPLVLTKTSSAAQAVPGDVLQYRITISNSDARRATGAITVSDTLPDALRLRSNTVRYNGSLVTPSVLANGRQFSVTLPALAPSASGLLTYLTEVRVDARTGDIANRAQANDNRGATSGVAEAFTRIERDGISERFTIVGRITEGACSIDPRKAPGIAGVRVMLQDGTYTVTDREGRYHFEGIRPGLHVVQVDPSTFPLDQEPVDCAQNTRSAGSDISRFVEGQGGSLKRADFRARKTAPRAVPATPAQAIRPEAATDQVAAGAEMDWFAGQEPGIGWVFPAPDHNPRAKAVRVAIKHKPNQTVDLKINGKPVNPLAFEGERKSADGKVVISLWRGVELQNRTNALTATVTNAGGHVVETLTRDVHVSSGPMNAQFLKDKSVLVADGITRPVIAVRLTDRDGKPVHHGMVGDFSVPAPYTPAIEVDAQQAEQLSGLERASPVWRVHGDDGIAYIELAPTTASGTVTIGFSFKDGETSREQRVETWLDPGDRPWTVVGFAAGTVGFNTLDSRLEDIADNPDDIQVDGRIALYAKGRISGKWLMTLAYDSDKEEDETRFAGIIDPRSYYTIYADRSEQRYDAASVRRLYLRLERPQFYALFGDYDTGINEPQLARYQRAFNGVKAEYRGNQLSATAFGADTPNRFRREEIQGNGLSGPYALGSRDIIINSERIAIEVRDRFRSEQVIERRELTRHIDYDINYLTGTLQFREPIFSRADGFDPQFIIAEYEVDGIGNRVLNAGGRVSWKSADEKLQIGATAVHDESDTLKTDMGGVDLRYRPNLQTEVRAEIAASTGEAKTAGTNGTTGTALAWLVEAEHHGSKFDVLAYIRRQEDGFGTGQISGGQSGTRKFGADIRARMTKDLTLAATAYQEDFLTSNARRRAASGEAEYRTGATTLRAGLVLAEDLLSDGTTNHSTLAKLGGSQRLFDNKLELTAQTEFALGGQDESVDFPSRHLFGARYAITDDVKLIGAYEIADGEKFSTQTARVGFELNPWAGGKILATGNQQNIDEFGPRSFAAYGLSQSLRLSEKWSVDFSLDGNETLSGGIDPADILDPEQPVASGGFLSTTGALTEDFIAVTAGATYRHQDWSWASRAEYRAADSGDRYGFTSAVLKQIGNDSAIGGILSYFHAELDNGPSTDATKLELSFAHRPDDSRWSILNKTEAREDKVRGAVAGETGPIGGALLIVDGDVTSRRLINSLSVNYTPIDEIDDGAAFVERGEYSLFWGTRYVFDRFGPDDVEGWSNVVGADIRFDLNDTIDIGGAGTVRVGTGARTVSYSGGPTVGISPFENGYISLGYNVVGYDDRDFEESRYTRNGPFVTFRLKFDQTTLAGLGL